MGYKDITPGDKIAKAIGARFIKTEGKGTPAIEVAFEFEEPSTGTIERLNWQGWLSAGAAKRTMETLAVVLEYNGSEAVDESGVFTDPNLFNFNKEVKLVVDLEKRLKKNDIGMLVEATDKDGNEIFDPKIKWVNNLNSSKFGACSSEIVKNELASIGFKAMFLATKQENNLKTKPEIKQPVAKEKLPF